MSRRSCELSDSFWKKMMMNRSRMQTRAGTRAEKIRVRLEIVLMLSLRVSR